MPTKWFPVNSAPTPAPAPVPAPVRAPVPAPTLAPAPPPPSLHCACACAATPPFQVINQLLLGTDWGELEYLIIDMPPGYYYYFPSHIEDFIQTQGGRSWFDNIILTFTKVNMRGESQTGRLVACLYWHLPYTSKFILFYCSTVCVLQTLADINVFSFLSKITINLFVSCLVPPPPPLRLGFWVFL